MTDEMSQKLSRKKTQIIFSPTAPTSMRETPKTTSTSYIDTKVRFLISLRANIKI